MKRVIKYLILFLLILIPIGVSAEDDFVNVVKKKSKSDAIDACVTGDSDAYHCYRYTFTPKESHTVMYNTTVWTSKTLGCGFELTTWDYKACKSASLDITYEQCKDDYCRTISYSGYNGTPDFYDKRVNKDKDIVCDNLSGFHIIYRAITIVAPIITILFVTFDLVASIISGDAKKVSKFRSKLLRRIIALLILIILPVLLHFLVKTLSKNSYIKDAKYLKCVVLGYNDTDTVKTDPGSTLQPKEIDKPDLISSVKIDGKEVSGFKQSTKLYSITVPNSTSSVTISATTNSDSAEIVSGTGKQELQVGSNTVKVNATKDNINFDTITLKITREKSAATTKTTEKKTNEKKTTSNTSTKSYGTSKDTTTYTYKGTKYIVIKTKYPGGLSAYQKMIKSNGIYQSYLKNQKVAGAGGCCGGVSLLQSCGLYKGKAVTQKNVNKTKCNNSNNGCTGGWATKGKCTDSESELMKYIVKHINSGHPVALAVTGSKVTNKKTGKWIKPHYSRHFVTIVGYKGDGTSFKDLLVLDSWDGELKKVNASTTSGRRTQQSGVIIDNGSCSKNFANVVK